MHFFFLLANNKNYKINKLKCPVRLPIFSLKEKMKNKIINLLKPISIKVIIQYNVNKYILSF